MWRSEERHLQNTGNCLDECEELDFYFKDERL